MPGIALDIEGLHKRFHKGGDIHVLRGIDLRVEPGGTVAVLGPSGSGKSTFLHIVGTLDHPTSGTVRYDGKDVFAVPPRELDALRNRRVGFVFQFHHLLSDLTALDNAAMPGLIAGLSLGEARERAADALERVGLGARLRHRPGELSGGEQQRVAIARALSLKPGLLLADEPTGNLDPRTASAVFDEFMALGAEVGCTVIVVTHSRELAARCPRRLRLVEGHFEEETG